MQHGSYPPPYQAQSIPMQYAPQPHTTTSNTTVVVTGAPQTTVIQKPVKERFADKILLNILLSFIFPFWIFVWCCMCICESRQ